MLGRWSQRRAWKGVPEACLEPVPRGVPGTPPWRILVAKRLISGSQGEVPGTSIWKVKIRFRKRFQARFSVELLAPSHDRFLAETLRQSIYCRSESYHAKQYNTICEMWAEYRTEYDRMTKEEEKVKEDDGQTRAKTKTIVWPHEI